MSSRASKLGGVAAALYQPSAAAWRRSPPAPPVSTRIAYKGGALCAFTRMEISHFQAWLNSIK